MRKNLLIITLFAMTFMVNAQSKFGIKAGLNIASLTGDIKKITESKAGLYAGAYARVPLANNLTFQPEFLFSMQGAKFVVPQNYAGFNYNVKKGDAIFNYINIPLMFQYRFTKGFRGEFGPQLGINVGSKIKDVSGATIENMEINLLDFGVNFGVNYELSNGINFAFRYNLGLLNINSDDNNVAKNSVFSLGIGFTFL
jgi:hypothetical protein